MDTLQQHLADVTVYNDQKMAEYREKCGRLERENEHLKLQLKELTKQMAGVDAGLSSARPSGPCQCLWPHASTCPQGPAALASAVIKAGASPPVGDPPPPPSPLLQGASFNCNTRGPASGGRLDDPQSREGGGEGSF